MHFVFLFNVQRKTSRWISVAAQLDNRPQWRSNHSKCPGLAPGLGYNYKSSLISCAAWWVVAGYIMTMHLSVALHQSGIATWVFLPQQRTVDMTDPQALIDVCCVYACAGLAASGSLVLGFLSWPLPLSASASIHLSWLLHTKIPSFQSQSWDQFTPTPPPTT